MEVFDACIQSSSAVKHKSGFLFRYNMLLIWSIVFAYDLLLCCVFLLLMLLILRRLSILELVQYYTTGHVDYQDSKGL